MFYLVNDWSITISSNPIYYSRLAFQGIASFPPRIDEIQQGWCHYRWESSTFVLYKNNLVMISVIYDKETTENYLLKKRKRWFNLFSIKTRLTTIITAKHKKSDNQTNIDKYRYQINQIIILYQNQYSWESILQNSRL